MQTRDWIDDSLYNPTHGYFNQTAGPVGLLPEPIQFSQLSGQQAYLQHLRQWYDTLKVMLLHFHLQHAGYSFSNAPVPHIFHACAQRET